MWFGVFTPVARCIYICGLMHLLLLLPLLMWLLHLLLWFCVFASVVHCIYSCVFMPVVITFTTVVIIFTPVD